MCYNDLDKTMRGGIFMKFWKSEDPCLRKEHRILTWAVVGQLILYVLFSVVLAILTWGQFIGGWVILGVMGLLGLVYVPVLLAAAQFIRWRITVKHRAEVPDRALDKALSVIAFVSGMTALGLFLLTTFMDLDPSYPWSDVYVTSQMNGFMTIALLVALAAVLLNYVMQWILRAAQKKQEEAPKTATVKWIRVAAMALLVLLLLSALLIPYSHGTYNDGGSRFYKATMYEVICWDRCYAEDAMALPDDFDPNEKQRTRIYFFPFNAYEFNAKWEMKH